MSKIDEYNEAKRRYELASEYADMAGNKTKWDKLGVRVQINGGWKGRYGDSSTYPWADEIMAMFREEVELNVRDILMAIRARRRDELDKAASAAATEAREILSRLEEDSHDAE